MICELVKLNRVVRKVLRVPSPFGQEDFSPFSGPSYGNELSQFAALKIGMQIVLARFGVFFSPKRWRFQSQFSQDFPIFSFDFGS